MLAALRESTLVGAIMSDHLPLPEDVDPDRQVSMREEDLPGYIETLREFREQYAVPELVIGLEADWANRHPEWTAKVVASARADGVEVILGSVHILDEWAFDDPAQVDEWEQRGVDVIWEQYFTEWCRAVESGLFDVMSHPDLPKKFGHRPRDPRIYYEEAARVAAEAGILCELSTGGLRKACAEMYPAPFFLAELVRRGVRFTLGSDAHSAGEIAYRFDEAANALLALGVTEQAFPKGNGVIDYLSLQ
jgi:histidinol-phosphatase (PHP family)